MMSDIAHFSVDGKLAANDPRAERLADRLVSETDSEERDRLVGADEIEDASGTRRRPRSRRNDDCPRLRCDQSAGLEGVVANDVERGAGEALDLLDQVVGEGVVVIDYDDRCGAKDAPG